MLTRDQILGAPIPTRVVDVPEWGGQVTLRDLSIRARTEMFDALYANEEAVRLYRADQAKPEDEREGVEQVRPLDASILHLLNTIVEPETLKPIFTLDDYDQVIDLSRPVINHLYGELMALEGRAGVADQKKSSD